MGGDSVRKSLTTHCIPFICNQHPLTPNDFEKNKILNFGGATESEPIQCSCLFLSETRLFSMS